MKVNCKTLGSSATQWSTCILLFLRFPSIPDLKDYSVQVGLLNLSDSSRHPRLRISRLICGPEGSNLVMLKLEE